MAEGPEGGPAPGIAVGLLEWLGGNGRDTHRLVLFEGKGYTIGREADCEIELPEPPVSRHHSEVVVRGGEVLLRDLQSQCGTQVNGVPVSERPLADGDLLQVGEIALRFLAGPRDIRVCRQCEGTFRTSENHDSACSYHSGPLLDYDRIGRPGPGLPGDFWDCCGGVVPDHGGDVPGCAHGRHVEALPPEELEPAVRDASPTRAEQARVRLRQFLIGRLPEPSYGRDLARLDTRIVESASSAWLLDRLGDARYPLGRRGFIAALRRHREQV